MKRTCCLSLAGIWKDWHIFKFVFSLDSFIFLIGMLSRVDEDHGTGQRGYSITFWMSKSLSWETMRSCVNRFLCAVISNSCFFHVFTFTVDCRCANVFVLFLFMRGWIPIDLSTNLVCIKILKDKLASSPIWNDSILCFLSRLTQCI